MAIKSKHPPEAARIQWLREEVSRISNTTLAGNFVNPDDRAYWVDRLEKLTSELSAFEQSNRPGLLIPKKGTQ
jgi:hypothetical protein